MKKFVALVLGSAMAFSTVLGLAACGGPDKPNNPTPPHTQHVDANNDGLCDECGQSLGPIETGDTRHDGIEDPREADAYTVYGLDGTQVGVYSNLAAAIRAAVDNDLDAFEAEDAVKGALGSYVTKKGSDTKVFQNRKSGADTFYYYKDNAWMGFEDYATGIPNIRLNASDWTVYGIKDGLVANTSVQAYDAYDGLGQKVAASTLDVGSTRGWEVDLEYDASIKCTPVREAGAVGSKYTVDLTGVKVTPPYKGVKDKTFAYMGFLIGSGSYTDDFGLACDTATGVWYQYRMHNPINTASLTAEFNIGEPIMTSTWHEEGYFTPDFDALTFYIMEEKFEDDEGEEYWADHYTIYKGEEAGKPEDAIFELVYDDSVINESNPGSAFDELNGFFFSAGLYIYNDGEVFGSTIGARDYTNGSKFENLVISSSEVYIAEEGEDVFENYSKSSAIDPELAGWNDTRTATFDGNVGKGFYNYTLVQGTPYVNYVSANSDGYEQFTFSYAGPAVNENPLGGELKEVQDQIDSLKAITPETAYGFTDTINAVGTLYAKGEIDASQLNGYVYAAVNWQPYLDALKVYNSAAKLSDEGQAIVDALDGLSNLDLNEWKGYKATGAEKKGYIFSETMDVFGELYAKYWKLPESDQSGIEQLGGEIWARWVKLYEDLSAIEYGTFGSRTFTVATVNQTATETLTGRELVASLFDTAAKLAFPCQFQNAEKTGPLHPDEVNRFFFAGTTEGVNYSFRVLYIRELLKENDVELTYLEDYVKLLSGSDSENQFSGAGFVHDWEGYLYPMFRQVARIENGECTYLDAELAKVVNSTKQFDFMEPGFNWNLDTNKSGSMGGVGEANWGTYFGFSFNGRTMKELMDATVLKLVKAAVPNVGISENGLSVTQDVTALDKAPEAMTQEATQFVTDFSALELDDLYELSAWKGFVPAGEETEGYVYPTLDEVIGERYEAWVEFSANDKLLIKAALEDTYFEDYLDLYEAIFLLSNDETQFDVVEIDRSIARTAHDTSMIGKTFTKMSKREILAQFIDGVFFINREPKSDQWTGHVSTQGYLCCDDYFCMQNTFYTLYIEKQLRAAGVNLIYIDRIMEALANDGPTDANNAIPDLANGARVMLDFEYLYNVGKQLGRIARYECTYLDNELAYVINNYMISNEDGKGNWGSQHTFHNGTLCFGYYAAGMFSGAGYDFPMFLLFDKDLYEVNPKMNWATAMKPLIDIITRDVGASILQEPTARFQERPVQQAMLVKAAVHAVVAPLVTAETFVGAFNKLALTDITDITAWKGGSSSAEHTVGYVQYEVGQFGTVYPMYRSLSTEEVAKAKAQIPTLEKWVTLYEQYTALLNDPEIVEIVHVNFVDKVKVQKWQVANAFFNTLFAEFDGEAAHGDKNGTSKEDWLYGYLCVEHDGTEESPTHLFNSIRALYCYYWLQDNNLPLDFAKDMLDLACNFEKSRPSKYIGITETAGLVKDWEYLRAVGGQIARIINGDCTYLDEELADVVNTYMVARGTEDKKDEGAGYYGCYESFHNMSFSNCYRKFGGDIMKDTQKAKDWKYYLNETLGKAQMTWADLLKTYLIPILEEAEGTGIMVPPRDFPNATGMVVAHEVTAQEAPQK